MFLQIKTIPFECVSLRRLRNRKLLKNFKDSSAIVSMEFNPKEYLLATASMDKTIKIYDIEDFECIATTPPDATKIRSITYSEDGRYIYGATPDYVKVSPTTIVKKPSKLVDPMTFFNLYSNSVDRSIGYHREECQ